MVNIGQFMIQKQVIIIQVWKPRNNYDWTQNMMYWSNQLHEYMKLHPHKQVQYPCGPKYLCKRHKRTACTQCTHTKGEYPSTTWNVEWCCNTCHCAKMFVFDSKSGLAMTSMKAIPRQ